MATVQLVRDTLPDNIGVSVSYPLPGTKFYTMVKPQLGAKAHWEESDDLAMMFQGMYGTPFYRQLHTLLHRELELRQRIHAQSVADPDLWQALDRLNADWFALGQLETQHRSARPTLITKDYDRVEAPDLSKGRQRARDHATVSPPGAAVHLGVSEAPRFRRRPLRYHLRQA
jgi:hypothetical protein